MKQYILVQVHADKTARSTYFEVEAPSYMYAKWENLLLEKPKLLKVMLEKGPDLPPRDNNASGFPITSTPKGLGCDGN